MMPKNQQRVAQKLMLIQLQMRLQTETPVPEEKVVLPAILGDSVLLYSLRGTNDVDEESEAFPNRCIIVFACSAIFFSMK